jgi:tetratricopeptide (TPR) repeat protein/DNA-binding XRE family transcriptional regulator
VSEESGGERSLGSWLRRQREDACLTQQELAERSGLSVRAISNLERGRTRRPYPNSVRLLTDALGLAETVGAELVTQYRASSASRPDGPWPPGRDPVRSAQGLTAGELARALTVTADVPRQLPARPWTFVGRRAELDWLTGRLGNPSEAAGATPVIVIGGTAGVGKTALAVHWAYEVTRLFPDGQLYVDLRGYDPGQPVPSAEALAGFLRALGMPGADIPAETDERAARYRTLLASRRMLVLLDNAGSVDQVRPLLPGASGCMAVVTSRDVLAGLVARDGAQRLDLDLLPVGDALHLLRELIGARVDGDPRAAAVLVSQCARLPLALRVAAELAVARPFSSLASLTGELSNEQRRLDLLAAGGDSRTAVRAVLSWSYRNLDPRVARAFRLAGLHPGPDFDGYALAALTGTTAQQASQLLEPLARANLVGSAGSGRYGLHDLLRSYARELTTGYDGEADPQAALTSLFDYYHYGAVTASRTLFPATDGLAHPAAPVSSPALATQTEALAWLTAERACLSAVIAYTAEHGWPHYATRLAAVLGPYLESGGHFPEAITMHSHATRAARLTGDRSAEANALNSVGRIDWRQGRSKRAYSHLQQALAIFRADDDLAGQAQALLNLGITSGRQSGYREAVGYFQEALTLFRQAGNQVGQARALNNLAIIDLLQGRYRQARVLLRRALVLEQEAGDQTGELLTLNNLCLADLRRGHYRQARHHIERALVLCLETGDRPVQAHILATCAEVDLRQDDYREAIASCKRSLALCSEIGDKYSQAVALNVLGETLLAVSEPQEAREHHAAALHLATQIGDKYEQARAHYGLASAYHRAGELAQARSQWQQSLALYLSLGAPEAAKARTSLELL